MALACSSVVEHPNFNIDYIYSTLRTSIPQFSSLVRFYYGNEVDCLIKMERGALRLPSKIDYNPEIV